MTQPFHPLAQEPAADVVRRAQAGDAGAVEELTRWCYPRVSRWALGHTGDSDEADDVTQDVIVALPSRLAGFRGESRFSTWLYRVTANAVAETRRTAARRTGLRARWWRAPAPADEERRRVDTLQDQQLVGLVHTLLHELPPQQRMVFDLADLQDRDTGEIAELLEVEAATVRSHLMRARRTLRQKMLESLPSLKEDR